MRQHCVSLVLASGEGSRFAGIKQLADVDGQPMLLKVVQQQIDISDHVVVVLGAHADRLESMLENVQAEVVVNGAWRTGMSSSIRQGVAYVERAYPETKHILIVLADQPFIPETKFDLLVSTALENPDSIIASEYSGTSGVPAVFPQSFWGTLKTLSGDQGARKVVRNNASVVTVPIPEAAMDIDTSSDLDQSK